MARKKSRTLRTMVGRELIAARMKAGMSQEQAAFRAGVDRSYLSEIESDKKSPTVKKFFAICAALGVSAADIIRRIDRSSSSSRR